MTNPPARSAEERKRDVLQRFEHDVDTWVASADKEGNAYLMPLSFLWDGTDFILSTAAANPTARNILAAGRCRLGIGLTRDVVLVDGTLVETVLPSAVSTELGTAFAAKAGFDPRKSGDSYLYFKIRPQHVQAWREVNELKGRDLMIEGLWQV